jgi:putative aldouronate transport system permease protein
MPRLRREITTKTYEDDRVNGIEGMGEMRLQPKRMIWFRKYWDLYLIMVPGILFFLVFRYAPMWGIVIAFQDYSVFSGIKDSEWVGFKHFLDMFGDNDFAIIFRNTLLISSYKLIWGFPAPIIIALMLNEIRLLAYKRTIQTLIYLPHFLSWVIIGGILFNLLSPSTGMVNKLVQFIGFEPILFLGDPSWFRTIIVASDIWKDAGWGAIIYLAALAGIDPQLYEAAIVDGANKWKQLWHVTLPSIMGTVVILFVLRLGHVLEVGFEQIFVLYNPLVYEVADVIETYVYRVGITQAQFSFSTAVGLFKSIIGLILVVIANKVAKKLGQEGIW